MRSQHPALNILKGNDTQNVEIKQHQHGAYSLPQTNKAPIAHMDSEEENISGRRGGGEMNDENEKSTEELVNLAETTTGWLFSAEIVFEAIKASNNEAQRLIQVSEIFIE
jgi:hypothetical protein